MFSIVVFAVLPSQYLFLIRRCTLKGFFLFSFMDNIFALFFCPPCTLTSFLVRPCNKYLCFLLILCVSICFFNICGLSTVYLVDCLRGKNFAFTFVSRINFFLLRSVHHVIYLPPLTCTFMDFEFVSPKLIETAKQKIAHVFLVPIRFLIEMVNQNLIHLAVSSTFRLNFIFILLFRWLRLQGYLLHDAFLYFSFINTNTMFSLQILASITNSNSHRLTLQIYFTCPHLCNKNTLNFCCYFVFHMPYTKKLILCLHRLFHSCKGSFHNLQLLCTHKITFPS